VGRLEVAPFADEHLDEAGRLLAARHARHRRDEPLLPARFEEPRAARDEVARAWGAEDASGGAAFRDDRLVGYLVGAPREDVWGANVWIEAAGHAVEEAEDVRDLYALAAARWYDEGRSRHYALVPASDAALVDAWFRLGFGQQQAHAVQEIPPDVQVRAPDGVEVRAPTEADVDALTSVDLALPTHQRASPVFSERPLPSRELIVDEWRKTLAGDEERVVIALLEGRPVACWSTCDARLSMHYRDGLTLPEKASYLAFAATVPDARGSGVGLALTAAVLAAARDEGYESMVTDWRVTNLLASRFWPRRGFRSMFFRLYRSIP
jgi:ribosomal protein S18 acetylase RimI-like enzyme